MGMVWADPHPVECPTCGKQVEVPATTLKALQATCPACGASLADVGERLVSAFKREQARFVQEVEPFLLAFDLCEESGLIPDSERDAIKSLNDVFLALVRHLPPTTDQEARAAEIIAEAERQRGREWLLAEVGAELVRASLELDP